MGGGGAHPQDEASVLWRLELRPRKPAPLSLAWGPPCAASHTAHHTWPDCQEPRDAAQEHSQ